MRFDGKVWVVTGASSGIGRRTAIDAAARGARVCAVARRGDRLKALVAEIGGEAAGHSFVVADVSERDQVKDVARDVQATYGRCDVLVNNAGISSRGFFEGPDSIDELHRVMQTNFFGAAYCMAELLPLLEASAPAHVVNVASMAGRIAIGAAFYTASKFALVGLTEALEPQLARRGIHLTSIEPGFIPTEGFPQEDFVGHPVMKRLLGTEAQVSEAIQDAVARRKVQRVVPRWYYLWQVPRVLAPGLFRRGRDKVLGSGLARGREGRE